MQNDLNNVFTTTYLNICYRNEFIIFAFLFLLWTWTLFTNIWLLVFCTTSCKSDWWSVMPKKCKLYWKAWNICLRSKDNRKLGSEDGQLWFFCNKMRRNNNKYFKCVIKIEGVKRYYNRKKHYMRVLLASYIVWEQLKFYLCH